MMNISLLPVFMKFFFSFGISVIICSSTVMAVCQSDSESFHTIFSKSRQYGNIRVEEIRKEKEQHVLDITFGGITEHPYASVGFIRKDGIDLRTLGITGFSFWYRGDGSDQSFRIRMTTLKDGKQEVWCWKSSIFREEGLVSTALPTWQKIDVQFRDFCKERDDTVGFSGKDIEKITFVGFGNQSTNAYTFPINKPFSFYIGNIVLTKKKERNINEKF